MIPRGERAITVKHARTLGRRFGISAGVFIEQPLRQHAVGLSSRA
jgi:hypothetical protein